MDDAAPPAPADVPPVVAVVVTCDPGWWLEPCLRALVAQDYPQLAVLVIDAGSAEDPTPRVAAVAPNAYVRRVRRRRGFGAAANEVLEVVEGASHFVFCHDDVAPAPNAVRLLVEEALRSNAGIVAPKLVDWWAPDRMLAAGMGTDAYGRAVPLLERGELDQQQHDAVRDVFFAPSACLVVRADLFSTLGGFDVGYGIVGEDLDLAWRGHLAGARVVFAPGARVRHIEVTDNGRRALDGSLRAGAGEAVADTAAADLPDGVPGGGDDGDALGGALAVASSEIGPGSDDGGVVIAPPVAPPGEPSGDNGGEIEWWDLRRWDEEDDAQAPGSVATAARGGRRRRHHDVLDPDPAEDEEWEPAWTGRRRRGPSHGGVEATPHDVIAGETPTPARPRGPDADALDELRAEARLRAVASDYGLARAVGRLATMLAVSLVGAAVVLVRRGGVAARKVMRPWRVVVRDARGFAGGGPRPGRCAPRATAS